jgi:secreted Zn-dependent insulinase-like peptidase
MKMEPFLTLYEQSMDSWGEMRERRFAYDYRIQEVEAIKGVTKEDLRKFIKDAMFLHEKRKLLTVGVNANFIHFLGGFHRCR